MKITLKELKKMIRKTITESAQNASQVAARSFVDVIRSQEVKEIFPVLVQIAKGEQPDPQGMEKIKAVVSKLSDAVEALHNSLSQRTDFFGADSLETPAEHSGHDIRPVNTAHLRH